MEEQKLFAEIKSSLENQLDLDNSFHIESASIPIIKLLFKKQEVEGTTYFPMHVDLTISDSEDSEKQKRL